MVLEALMLHFTSKNQSLGTMLSGIVYTLLAIFLSLWIFKTQTAMLYIFFTVLACAPFIYRSIQKEEQEDLKQEPERQKLKAHAHVLALYMLLFVGICIGTAIAYLALPFIDPGAQAFSVQEDVISQIRGPTGNVTHMGALQTIFTNNMKVLLMCLIFSFLYGFGAIFILTWNASVVGVALGNTIAQGIGALGASMGITHIPYLANVISFSLLRYFTHGIFEIAGYFTIGLAGSIVSYALITKDFKEINVKALFTDIYGLMLISIMLIVLGTLIEVFITPALL